ncbi:MAG: hypothetical protein JSW71_19105 [Gemmatimonadota bacterium]|nr:MAG: hypothetical protein JSW71_19105 [Gemmatimonadota bacterium]
MLAVVILVCATALWAGFVYLAREELGATGLGLATLRTVGVAALLLLLFNPGRAKRIPGGAPIVLLDGSLSMGVPGGKWDSAVDTALAIAGSEGTIYRFGAGIVPFDTTPPSAGSSHLREPLLASRGSGRPLYVVTDGEIEDVAAIAPSVWDEVTLVVLPRDTVRDVALLDIDVRQRVQQADSFDLVATVGTWGPGVPDSAEIELWLGDRILAVRQIDLPPAPGVGRRQLRLPPRLLPLGTHVIHLRVAAARDSVKGNERRARVVTVTEQPDVVVIVGPADWEGRFLVSELSAVARTNVTGYARIHDEVWLDMSSLARVEEETVRATGRRAAMLVLRGADALEAGTPSGGQPIWRWLAGDDTTADFVAGDWYVMREVPASPLAGQLGPVSWESLPPLTGLIPVDAGSYEWVGLTGKLARRGAQRPVLVGRDTVGARRLVTVGSGLWRWAFRGGAAREAYRTLLSSGTDWLLQSGARRPGSTLTATPVVAYGTAVDFRWLRGSVPDSIAVAIQPAGATTADTTILRFAADRSAAYHLPPGEYRWSTPDVGAEGLVVVEAYSEEMHPRAIHVPGGGVASGTILVEEYARDRWWLFAIVVLALAGEWGWRYRKGLP